MSKKILPFPLVMKNGAKVRSIEELRENADIETIVSAYLDGKLNRWCKAFHYDDVPDKMSDVTEAMIWQIYETLGIKLEQEQIDAYMSENAVLLSDDVGVASTEAEVTDSTDIKKELSKYINDEINLDDYSIAVTHIEDERESNKQCKVILQNKYSKFYCSFVLENTKSDESAETEKWTQNLCFNITNALNKIKESIELFGDSQYKANDQIDGFVLIEMKEIDLYVCDHPVTQSEYKSIMGNNPSQFSGDDNPVDSVSWYDAIQYCNKRSEKEGLIPCYTGSGENIRCNFYATGYRLPSYSEWQYAASNCEKDKYIYSGSNDIDEVAWYVGNSEGTTHPVKQKKPNGLGIYDMTGNVWEWCQGQYVYDAKKRDCYGGGFGDDTGDCWLSQNPGFNANEKAVCLGFRIVRTKKSKV